jgi:hypothetical protein
MAYFNLFFTAYILYIFVKNSDEPKIVDVLSGWILLFLALVMVQPLLFDFQNSGIVANSIYFVIQPIIGEIGYALLSISVLILSIFVLIEQDNQFYKLYQELKGVQTYKSCSKKMAFGPDIFEEPIRNPFDSSRRAETPKNIRKSYTPPPAKSKLERERERLRRLRDSQRVSA